MPSPCLWICVVHCRPALKLLTAKTNLSSLKLDFIPWLTRHCLKASAAAAAAAGSNAGRLGGLSHGGSGGLNPTGLSPAELALARHGSGFLLSAPGGSGSFSNIAAAATAGPAAAQPSAAGTAAGDGNAAAVGSSGGAAAAGGGSSAAAAAAGTAAASSTAGSMAGDVGEFGEGADAWVSDMGMGLPGVLTGLGLPGEGYMALSHAGVFMCVVEC